MFHIKALGMFVSTQLGALILTSCLPDKSATPVCLSPFDTQINLAFNPERSHCAFALTPHIKHTPPRPPQPVRVQFKVNSAARRRTDPARHTGEIRQ